MKHKMILFALFLLIIGFIDIINGDATVIAWKVVKSFPHDSSAFTQGLMIDPLSLDGSKKTFLEGTGLVSRSTLRRVDLET
jgi:glutamine cyclotransferase